MGVVCALTVEDHTSHFDICADQATSSSFLLSLTDKVVLELSAGDCVLLKERLLQLKMIAAS